MRLRKNKDHSGFSWRFPRLRLGSAEEIGSLH
jgi:hypothetical protein